MAELVARGQGALPRPLRGGAGDDPPRARRAPDHGAADRVLALDARSRGRGPADRARARHRLRRVQPARPRLPDRARSARRTTSTPDDFRTQPAALPGRELPAEPASSSSASRRSPPRRASRRRSSRSRGCCAQGDDIVPIPGTKRAQLPRGERRRPAIELTRGELARIDEAFPRGVAVGRPLRRHVDDRRRLAPADSALARTVVARAARRAPPSGGRLVSSSCVWGSSFRSRPQIAQRPAQSGCVQDCRGSARRERVAGPGREVERVVLRCTASGAPRRRRGSSPGTPAR